MSSLQFRINRVQCLDETGGNWVSERGSDDIYLAAVTVDQAGSVTKVPAFNVGAFDDGTDKGYSPPHVLKTFSNIAEGTFPKRFIVLLILIERDSGSNIEPFLDALANKTSNIFVQPVAKGDWVGVGAKALIEVSKELEEWVKNTWKEARKDDIFPPATVHITIPQSGWLWRQNSESPRASLRYMAHDATYIVHYSWAIDWT